MKGSKSELDFLRDINVKKNRINNFTAAIKLLRKYFPNCDFYMALMNKKQNRRLLSVGVKGENENSKARSCVLRFRPNTSKIATVDDLYLDFSFDAKHRKDQINKALKDIGGLKSIKRNEKEKIRYGVSIADQVELNRVLKLLSRKDLKNLMDGKGRYPDDYADFSRTQEPNLKSYRSGNPIVKRKAVDAVDVELNENEKLRPLFVDWVKSKNIYDQIDVEKSKSEAGHRVDVSMINKSNKRKILCELKWIDDIDFKQKIRMAIGQLLEYRFYEKSKNCEIWLVLNQLPEEGYIEHLRGLEKIMKLNFHLYVLEQDNVNFKCII